jgi:hypothetical protein
MRPRFRPLKLHDRIRVLHAYDYDPNLNNTANNADPNWCYSPTPYSPDNDGTPGADNEQCP